jgi:hypothetical protein
MIDTMTPAQRADKAAEWHERTSRTLTAARVVRFVCPENGTRVDCPICGCPMPHQREDLGAANARPVPALGFLCCDTHRLYLVRAP